MKAVQWETSWLPTLAIALGLGVAAGLAGRPGVALALALATAIGRALGAPRPWIALAVLGLGAGWVVGHLALDRPVRGPAPGADDPVEGLFLVEVTDGARPAARPWTVRGHILAHAEAHPSPVAGMRVRILDPDLARPPVPGDRWWVRGRLVTPAPALHAAAFDARAFQQRRGLDGTLVPLGIPIAVPHAPGWRRRLDGWRTGLEQAILARVPEAEAGVVLALTTGSRGHIDPEVRDRFGRLGAAHVLAVSGMHLGLLTGTALLLVTAGFRRLGGGRRRRDGHGPAEIPRSPETRWAPRERAALLCIPAVALYVLLTGAPPSAVRAGWMTGALLVGLSLRRRVRPMNALALAAVVMLILEPLAVHDLGVQLSFAATGALVAWGMALRRARLQRPEALPSGRMARAGAALKASVMASLVASAATGPSLLHGFGAVPLGAPVANLLVVPPLALVALPAGVAGSVLSQLGIPGGGLVLDLAGLAVRLSLAVGVHVEPWIGHEWVGGRGPAWGVLAWIGLTAGLVCSPVWRRRRTFAVIVLSLAAVVHAGPERAPKDALVVHAIPVGHGDAFLVRMPGGGTLLVDAGGRAGAERGPGWFAVRPYLRSQGVDRVDVMVSTHGHVDHAGGLIELVGELRPREVWLGTWDRPVDERLRQEAERHGARSRWLHREASAVNWGETRIEVLPVPPGLGTNDSSLVLRICNTSGCALLTGDAEAIREADLAARSPGDAPLSAAVLKVGHHGSRTSSGQALLARVEPTLAVIPVAPRSPYGHPGAEVTRRLAVEGARIVRLDQGHAACLTLHAGRLELRSPVHRRACGVR